MRVLEGRCGEAWKACGEVIFKTVFKTANPNKKGYTTEKVDVKDCYFDEECHAKVDWKQIEKIKESFLLRLKLLKTKGDANTVNKMMPKVHKMFQEAGVPDERVDYILVKWVENVYPDALQQNLM